MAPDDRYVFDSNVLLSAAIFPNSTPGWALREAIRRGRLLLSQATAEELADVLRSIMRFNGLVVVALLLVVGGPTIAQGGNVKVWPAPEGEELSKDFSVTVDGQQSPVYVTKVAPGDPALRWKAMDDKANSANYYEKAAFTTFDMRGTVSLVVNYSSAVRSARVLPSSLKIVPQVDGNHLTISMTEPKPLTVEINGDWVHSLHILANPPEDNPPREDDPNVIYFGPGVHEVTHLEVGSGKTVYVAGGAVVRGVIGPDEPSRISSYSGLRTYNATFLLRGDGITFRGRGIIDGSRSTTHARSLLVVQGADVRIEGVILRDSSTWNLPIRESDRVIVENVKILGYRANSDGIDICNSRDVTVRNCFLRTLDDLIVVKTDRPRRGPAHRRPRLRAVERGGPRAEHRGGASAECQRRAVHELRRDPRQGPRMDAASLPLRLGPHLERAVLGSADRRIAAIDLALDRQGVLVAGPRARAYRHCDL